jgi:DNA-binding transcriptional regulator LsrR (DeoR family)
MIDDELPSCSKECMRDKKSCSKDSCRMWIDYSDDQNCSLVSIYHNGKMTLEEVAKRMKVSLVRVSQIEKEAMKKLSKRINFDLSI